MSRHWPCLIAFLLCACLPGKALLSAEQTPSEKAISEAIALLESKRDGIDDTLEQAKIDRAIRELEAMIEDPDGSPKPPPVIDFEVTPVALKKAFHGKATYSAKTGELTLTYDFAGKAALADFEVGDIKTALAKKALWLEGGDELKHVAKFKSFTVTAVLSLKSMRGVGIGSTNGTKLGTGGAGADLMILRVPGGTNPNKVVPANVRSGNVPVSLAVTANKTAVRYGNEQLAQPTVRKDDIHQIVLHAGNEGCGYSNLVITGVPDPVWLKEFLAAE